jgi:hypothetical protein
MIIFVSSSPLSYISSSPQLNRMLSVEGIFFSNEWCKNFYSTSLSCGHLRAWTGISLKGPRAFLRDGEHFSAILLIFLQCQVWSVRTCVIMLKDNVSSSGTCHKVHIAVSGASEHSKLYWHPLASLKTIAEDMTQTFSCWWWDICNTILCHSVSGL